MLGRWDNFVSSQLGWAQKKKLQEEEEEEETKPKPEEIDF